MFKLICLCVALIPAAVFAAIRTEQVPYQSGDTYLIATLVYDDARPAKSPGIVLFPEWWGANDYAKSRARMLAEIGYVALVADMYGNGKSTEDFKEAGELAQAIYSSPETMLARANAALTTLKGIQTVDSARMGAIGYCMGGNVALNLARSGADLKSVVAFHAGLANHVKTPGRIKAAILVCNGGDDKTISDDEQKAFIEDMRKAKADWQLILFGGALHSFTNPDADRYSKFGPVAYNQRADERSWQLMRNHLQATLAGKAVTNTKALDLPNPR